jgi:hypothetical protein
MLALNQAFVGSAPANAGDRPDLGSHLFQA